MNLVKSVNCGTADFYLSCMNPQGSIGVSMEFLEIQYGHGLDVKNVCVLFPSDHTTKQYPMVEYQNMKVCRNLHKLKSYQSQKYDTSLNYGEKDFRFISFQILQFYV